MIYQKIKEALAKGSQTREFKLPLKLQRKKLETYKKTEASGLVG